MSSFYLNYNGKTHNSDKLFISPNNRSFRYGDGFFETMKMVKGKILLRNLHFERLFSSLDTLKFDSPGNFTADALEEQIGNIAKKNGHTSLARIRLTVFRGDGGLYDDDNKPNYIIQTWLMNPAINTLNENGLVTGIFPDARKACDMFSPIKNNNYLCYAMAALWAKQQKLNDALVLNSHERIADASIANVFIVKDGVIKTPAITEGCVAGVVRRYLLQCCHTEGIPVEETSVSAEDVLQAQEVFLTNAGYGIRWVKTCGSSNYTPQAVKTMFNKFIVPLYA
ncbi:MAG TPA: aminotransferase class IV [Chitinophagaceae bacterium]|nr:aminotransferase class IV [Chitinophagaceae bacterium]